MIVCLDTNIVIYLIETNPVWSPKVTTRLSALLTAGDTIAVCDAARLECLVKPQLWDLASGKLLRIFSIPEWQIETARFSPDGRRVLLTFDGGICVRYKDGHECLYTDRAARLFDCSTGKEVAVLGGHSGRIVAAEFSGDGRKVVTASLDGSARVHEAATGKKLAELKGKAPSLQGALFSPDGRRVPTASQDGTARLWPVDPLPLAQSRKPRDLTEEERRLFNVRTGP